LTTETIWLFFVCTITLIIYFLSTEFDPEFMEFVHIKVILVVHLN